ncbi:MAG: cation:proton antiporter [Caldilineaceae bacterium]|nr:cation:proton antiporter [Caldilineaceae bacterium]HRJ41140.1 cation:proton antiporter [Caldilineaceae bacterium]
MDDSLLLLPILFSFLVIALASKEIGSFFRRLGLPLISGFLFTGIIAGPYVLQLLSVDAAERLIFLEEVALAFIAFSAGSELNWEEVRRRLRSIGLITAGLVVVTLSLGTIAVLFLADYIPFMQEMPPASRVAVALLAGAILVARSPSGAIAVINELRARGQFTQTVLGVTVIMDGVVITIFAINSSIADALLTNLPLNPAFLLLLLAELTASLFLGFVVAWLIRQVLHWNSRVNKFALILLLGYAVFLLADEVRHYSHDYLPFEFLLEPLLICMVAGFVVANSGRERSQEFTDLLHLNALPVYIAFFTVTGASLHLDVLASTWPIALSLFAVRVVSIFIGSFIGGTVAGEPMRHNRIRWLAFITQAGVALGLAQTVAVTFPEWGQSFATLIISVVVLNEVIGPMLFKWAINLAGEAHPRGPTPDFDGSRDALVFGLEGQALTLARQLTAHGWNVRVASRSARKHGVPDVSDVQIVPISDLSLETLRSLDAGRAEAIVTLLSDEENFQVCELAYEHFGTGRLITRLHDRANFERFHELGVLIVDPDTALIALLEHFVRSPVATSLVMGMEEGQDVVDLEMHNADLDGRAIRDLALPVDVLVLAVTRQGQAIRCHGYTRLRRGDQVTVVGSEQSLEELSLRFEAQV